MNDERPIKSGKSYETSIYASRLSSGYSRRYFDFLDSSHSIFSKDKYYNDMLSIHPWLRHPCSPYSGIPYSTLRAGPCSVRIEELAQPKIKRERLIRKEFFDNLTNYAYSGVKPTALKIQCSDRLAQLARSKPIPIRYRFAYDLPRAVPESALHAHLSKRTDQLAKPRYNKDFYIKALWNNKQ